MRVSRLASAVLAVLFVLLGTHAVSAAPLQQIQSFQLTTAKSGWLLAGNRLFFTTTLGSQWSEITPTVAATSTLSGVYFRPDGNGWVLESTANTLALAHTTDNGAHWTTTSIASPFTSASAFNGRASTYFPDAQHGFLMLGVQSSSAFSLGILLRTTDDGATWQQAPSPPAGGSITFLDATHGFDGPGPARDELYRTADAANTWQRVALASPAALATTNSTIALPIFTDATHGTLLRTYATDGGPTILTYTTADGGVTWTLASTASTSTPTLIALARDGSSTNPLTATASIAGLPSLAPATVLTPFRSSFTTASNGWVEFKSGSCVNGTCTQTDSLRGTLDGGRTYFSLSQISGIQLENSTTFTIPTKKTSSLIPLDLAPASSSVYNTAGVMGFDACSLPTLAQMKNWISAGASPYRVVGVYLGGENYANCSSTASLNATWVSTVLGEGWQIIPIWVGPQGVGACTSGCASMSSTPSTAMTQGETEADSIIAAANALGIGQGSTMMYDMEAYTRGGANTTATQSFLQGWTTELHAKGYLAATYSSHPEFTDWYPTVVNPDVDIIWFAYFFDYPGDACGTECQTVFPTETSFDISPSYWLNNHRARQTSAGFESAYGSYTIDIDEDWVDAPMVTATPNKLTVTIVVNGVFNDSVASTTIANLNGDTSTDTAINCGLTCSADFAPTDTLTLVATNDSISKLSSWTGCTSTSGNTCTVLVSAAKTVTAIFVGNISLTVNKAGTGTGTITSADNTINCGTTCSATYTGPTTETLTAAPATGSMFQGWTGCTTATGTTCVVSITNAAAVTATFIGPLPLTVAKSGIGSGTITSTAPDAQINCGSACSGSYLAGTTITLSATAAAGSQFTSWNGCTSTSGSTCTITLSAASTVTATFTAAAFSASPASQSLTVVAGQSVSDVITITPSGGYTGTFDTFACGGLPGNYVSCSFSPTSLTANGSNTPVTTTLTFSTTTVTAQQKTSSSVFFAGLLLPSLLLPFAIVVSKRGKRLRKGISLAIAIFALALLPMMIGCGGSSTPSSPTGPIFSGTITVSYRGLPTSGASAAGATAIQLTVTH